MPVNEKNGSEELLERGWRQMSGVLDREMPQKSHNRWGLWIPLGLLGLVLIIIALNYLPGDEIKNAVPETQTNPHQSFVQAGKDPTSDDNVHSLISPVETAVDHEGSGTDISQIEQKSEAVVPAHEETEVRVELLGSLVNSDLQPGEEMVNANDHVQVVNDIDVQNESSELTTIPDNIEVAELTDGDDISSPLFNDDEAPGDMRSSSQQEIHTMLALDIVTPTPLDYSPAIQPIVPAATLIRPKFGLEVFGAPHFVSPIEIYGVEAGALASLTLGTRWKILGGVSYGHYNKSGLVSLGNKLDNADAESLTVPVVLDPAGSGNPVYDTMIAYGKIGYDTAQLLSEKFNYLHLPVTVQYRLGRFISVTGGFKVSYLLNAPSGKRLSAEPRNSSQVDLFDLNNSRNFLVEENILKKWDFAPVVGIAIDVGRRLAMDVQYQHGLIPYVDRDTERERSDYHRSLSLGLRYRIL